MQGQDKGLLHHQGLPLASWGLRALAPQVSHLGVIANRNLSAYETLLAQALASNQASTASLGVRPDDARWPQHSGPLAGMLTALAHSPTDWVLLAPCDTPGLPPHLLDTLMQAALREQADIAVPLTQEDGHEPRHHWVCALMHKRVFDPMQDAFVKGERKVRVAIGLCKWTGVSFAHHRDFDNMNTLETLHGGD